MPEQISTDILIATARDKHGLVVSPGQIDALRSMGAPICDSGDFDPLDLAAWLIAAAQGDIR